MLNRDLLHIYNKNFVIKQVRSSLKHSVLCAMSLVHCRHSLSVYGTFREGRGQWELRENEELEPPRVFPDECDERQMSRRV